MPVRVIRHASQIMRALALRILLGHLAKAASCSFFGSLSCSSQRNLNRGPFDRGWAAVLAEHTVWDSASTGSGLGAPRFESASEATSPNSQRSQLSERSLCRLGEEDIEEAYARLGHTLGWRFLAIPPTTNVCGRRSAALMFAQAGPAQGIAEPPRTVTPADLRSSPAIHAPARRSRDGPRRSRPRRTRPSRSRRCRARRAR